MSMNISNVANSVCQVSLEISKELDSLAERAFQLQKQTRVLQEKVAVRTEEKSIQVDTLDPAGYTVLDTVPAHMQKPFEYKAFDRRINWSYLKSLNLQRMMQESETRGLMDIVDDLSRADLESESVYNTTESNLLKIIKAQQMLLQYLQDSLSRQQRQRRRMEEDRAIIAGGLQGMRADTDLAPVSVGLRYLQQDLEGLAHADVEALVRQVRLEERMAKRAALNSNSSADTNSTEAK